jgi:hypothetical protein
LNTRCLSAQQRPQDCEVIHSREPQDCEPIHSRRAHGAVGYPVVPNLAKPFLPPMTKTGPDPLPTTRIEPLVIVMTFAVIEDVLAPSRARFFRSLAQQDRAHSPTRLCALSSLVQSPNSGCTRTALLSSLPSLVGVTDRHRSSSKRPLDRSSGTLFPDVRRAHANSAASSNARCRVKSYGRRGL